jgi:G3E family GTPase
MSSIQNETLSMLNGLFEAARLIPARMDARRNTLPLTIISGFLGAGKTTLLNNLLSEQHGRRLAVLVNDFGEINIDAALVKARNEAAITLTNGCVCCTVAGDLTKAIIQLSDSPEPPDSIVLEASGVADPRGIAQIALANPALSLDGVLTLVDGDSFEDRYRDPELVSILEAQISAADIILLNKCDLIGERTIGLLNGLVGKRTVIQTTQADIPSDVVLGVRTQRSMTIACLPEESHRTAFRSWNRVWSKPLERDRLTAALDRLPAYVIRAKGIFHFRDNPSERFVYQRVGQRSKLTPDDSSLSTHSSSLVVIGPASKLDVDTVSDCLEDVI